jgi:hypothetical protein
MDATTQYALAYALTTTAGLRGFLTLFAASVAAHYHVIHPSPAFMWLGADGTVLVLGVFALLEMVADKVPAVDHALHAVSFAVRPVAAAILVGGTVNTSSPGELVGLMAAGALNALVVHTSSATARAASSMATFGLANPAISIVEDVLAIASLVVTFAFPIIAAVLALVVVIALIALGWRAYVSSRAAPVVTVE